MEIITPKIINFYLRSYIDTLHGEELVYLRETLLDADQVLDLPGELRDKLHLKDYLLTQNVVEIIQKEFDKLITGLCQPVKLVDLKQRRLIRDYIQSKLEACVENWKARGTVDEVKLEDDNDNSALSPELLEYSKFLLDKILEGWRGNLEVTPKFLSQNEAVTLVIKHPLLRLSSCKEIVEKWSKIFQGHLTEVHFVAKEMFLADCSLDNDEWHGKCILVFSKKIECLEESSLVWDLSGSFDEESGGHFLGICKEYCNMQNLKIISSFGTKGPCVAVQQPNVSGMSLTRIMSIFPPSANSDTLRKLVFENAMNFEGNKTAILYEPKDAYDVDARKVTGQVTDFYMEGETETGCKFYVGFRKGLFTKNAFCFVQGKEEPEISKCEGEVGTVTFVSIDDPNSTIPLEEVGLEVVAENSKRAGWVMVNELGGNDVGYMTLNAKQTVEYPAGRYELKMEDEQNSDSINCKILGKFLRIIERAPVTVDKPEISNPVPIDESSIFQNPSKAFALYGNQVGTLPDDKAMEKLLTAYELEWWSNKLFSLDDD